MILYELHFGWNFEELLLGNDKLRLRKWWINGDSNPAGNKEHRRNVQQKYFTLFDCLRILNHDVVFQLQCLSESQKQQISQEESWLWIVLLLLACKVRHSLSHHTDYSNWFNNWSLTCIHSTAGLCSKQFLSTQHVQPEHCVPRTYEICNACNLLCNSFKFHCSCPGYWKMHQKIKVNAALDDSSPPQISRAASGPSTETLGTIGKLTYHGKPTIWWDLKTTWGPWTSRSSILKHEQMYPIDLPVPMEYQGFHLHVPPFYRHLLHLEDSVHKYDPTRRSFGRPILLLGHCWWAVVDSLSQLYNISPTWIKVCFGKDSPANIYNFKWGSARLL